MKIDPEAVYLVGASMLKQKAVWDQRLQKPRYQDANKQWRSAFGASPTVISVAWNLLDEKGKHPNRSTPKHMLWGLLFLKAYSSEFVHCCIASGSQEKVMDVKTFRKWSWKYVELIGELEADIILWENRLKGSRNKECKTTVDCVDFKIMEQSPFWPGWKSHKFNGPALRYEIAMSIEYGDIVWWNGPFPAGAFPDVKIFNQSLRHMLDYGEMCEADRIYKCTGHKACNPASFGGVDYGRAARGRHEVGNRRVKQFNALSHRWKHDIEKNVFAFKAALVLTQLGIENGEPIFDVDYQGRGELIYNYEK